MRRLLTNRGVSVTRRLKLLEACIGSCILYGSNSWTPRADEISFLKAAQNKMMRLICGFNRAPTEQWHEWIRRTTRRAWHKAHAANLRSWIEVHAQRKWLWAGHVSRMSSHTWAWRVTFWRDSEWTRDARKEGPGRLMRPSRGRCMKFEDSVRRYAALEGIDSWTTLACNRDDWTRHSAVFSKSFAAG